jgi:hypothetical protein
MSASYWLAPVAALSDASFLAVHCTALTMFW